MKYIRGHWYRLDLGHSIIDIEIKLPSIVFNEKKLKEICDKKGFNLIIRNIPSDMPPVVRFMKKSMTFISTVQLDDYIKVLIRSFKTAGILYGTILIRAAQSLENLRLERYVVSLDYDAYFEKKEGEDFFKIEYGEGDKNHVVVDIEAESYGDIYNKKNPLLMQHKIFKQKDMHENEWGIRLTMARSNTIENIDFSLTVLEDTLIKNKLTKPTRYIHIATINHNI